MAGRRWTYGEPVRLRRCRLPRRAWMPQVTPTISTHSTKPNRPTNQAMITTGEPDAAAATPTRAPAATNSPK